MNAIVGTTPPQSIFKPQKDIRKLSEFKRLSEWLQTVVRRPYEFLWISESLRKPCGIPLDIGRLSEAHWISESSQFMNVFDELGCEAILRIDASVGKIAIG
jgi:hypothetical protein